jgi:hypothetical protein
MRTILKTITVLFIANIFLSACAGGESNQRNANFLPPLKITIADEIKGDTELVEVIESSEKAINEFSDNIEQLAIDGKDLFEKSKNDEEASVMDKLKAGKLMIEFASNSTQMIATMEKFTTYMDHKKEQGTITDEQLKALEQVGTAFNNRIEEINKKYKDYFDQ